MITVVESRILKESLLLIVYCVTAQYTNYIIFCTVCALFLFVFIKDRKKNLGCVALYSEDVSLAGWLKKMDES